MNSLGMILVVPVVAAGILFATLTTIVCLLCQVREDHDRKLFLAYLNSPRDVEAWLVKGAIEQVEQTLEHAQFLPIAKKTRGREVRDPCQIHRFPKPENATSAMIRQAA